jgi:hypothetical protein
LQVWGEMYFHRLHDTEKARLWQVVRWTEQGRVKFAEKAAEPLWDVTFRGL